LKSKRLGKKIRIGLVLLNKNEERNLIKLLPKLNLKTFDDYFAIDGGSSDNSKKLIQLSGIQVLDQISKGRGAAFSQGFKEAKLRNLEALVFFSTDGNEDPGDFGKFRPILERGADIVIGSRMLKGARNEEDSQILKIRKWGNKFFAWSGFLLLGRNQLRITDPINGYRAISLTAWEKMGVESLGFSVEYETSLMAYKLNLKVEEFPTIELPREFGESSAKALKTTMAMTRTLFKTIKKETL